MRIEISAYKDLAESYSATLIWEESFLSQVASLPPLTHNLLDELHQVSVQIAHTRPRLGWALLVVVNAAAQQHQPNDRFLQAKAAWYEAYSANEWVDVERAAAALDRAERLFADLGESGWLAACQWQRNTYPWTRPSVATAQTELTRALERLKTEAGLARLIPLCRLSLAYSHLLNWDFEISLELIRLSEADLNQQADRLNQARCKFVRAANLRRQPRFEEALREGLAALDAFQREGAMVDVARTQSLLTIIYWYHLGDFTAALQALQTASELFAQMEIPLWIQQNQHILAQLYTVTGNLVEADQILDQIINRLKAQNMIGPLGDSLLDRAINASWRNDYDFSLSLFSEAQALAEQHQRDVLLALTILGQATVYQSLNRYQDALAATERSYHYFVRMKSFDRMASCELELATIWLRLGRTDKAHEWLDKAEKHQQTVQEADLLNHLYLVRAEAYHRQRQLDEAVTILQTARNLTQQQGKIVFIPLLDRLLSKVLLESGRLEEARNYLQKAEMYWVQQGQELEQAACQLIWGEYYRKMGDSAAATQAWQRALQLNQGMLPELLWQAQGGLAGLAQERGAIEEALVAYAAAIEALTHQRENLKQASLSSSFFKQPGVMVDQAIGLAITTGNHDQALHFIETSKAVILTQQLKMEPLSLAHLPPDVAQRLNDLSAEIRQLSEKLHQRSGDSALPLRRSQEEIFLRQQIRHKAQAYEELIDLAETQLAHWGGSGLPLRHFALPTFRSFAQQALGNNWVALDYHLAQDHLYSILITPEHCLAWQQKISWKQEEILDMMVKLSGKGKNYVADDFQAIGDLLFPDWIWTYLTPETTLLISPHQKLHHLPWAALQPKSLDSPLVTGCIPVLVPSLHSLTLLWQRSGNQPFALKQGLLLTVGEFQGRHPALVGVVREAETLREQMGEQVVELRDAAATWSNFLEQAQNQGLKQYNWLHIASHAFHDRVTGWLSGFALYDRDVWLTELKQCAPLPHLMTLSVCSGSRNHVQHGDEQISLSTTCLVAGAQTVISNLWPLPDDTTPEWMGHFYHHISNGKSIALALALAQRAAWEQQSPLFQWSGFSCMGQP